MPRAMRGSDCFLLLVTLTEAPLGDTAGADEFKSFASRWIEFKLDWHSIRVSESE